MKEIYPTMGKNDTLWKTIPTPIAIGVSGQKMKSYENKNFTFSPGIWIYYRCL